MKNLRIISLTRIRMLLAPIVAILLLFATSGVAWAATSGSSSVTSGSDISGSGTATVELALSAEPGPTDVFILLDASGSIVHQFQDELLFAVNLVESLGEAGLFENGGRVGVIRFASTADVVIPLTDNESALTSDIGEILFTSGGTCTSCAINLATATFNSSPPFGTNRIMIVITDGWANSQVNSVAAKDAAEAAGVEIFGLGVGNGVNEDRLAPYCSAPSDEHVFLVNDFGGLDDILEFLIPAVMQSGVTNIEVVANVSSRFGSPTNPSPSKGTAVVTGQSVTWNIAELGTLANPNETATLTYDIAVSCSQGPDGELVLHDAINYEDDQDNDITFDLLNVILSGCAAAAIDIKPGSCPNPLNTKSKGVLPVAILGTVYFNVRTIDVATLNINGVAPTKSSYADVSAPAFKTEDCDCEAPDPDSFEDLELKFDTQKIVESLGAVNDGDEIHLMLTGMLQDGTAIEGIDCVVIKDKGKGKGK